MSASVGLVTQVLAGGPYRSSCLLFWVVENGSSLAIEGGGRWARRGEAAVRRLRGVDARIIVVHGVSRASWLNQVEIYFSIIQRKVLTPNDFASLDQVERRLRMYGGLSNGEPRPFDWKFDRAKLMDFLGRLEARRAERDGLQAP